MYWQLPRKNAHKYSEGKLLLCHLSPSRILVFLQNDWAQFVKDGWLVSKGLCKKLFLLVFILVILTLIVLKISVCVLLVSYSTCFCCWSSIHIVYLERRFMLFMICFLCPYGCQEMFVCDWCSGATVVGTLVGIDSFSPQGLSERKMAWFSISLLSIIALLQRPSRLFFNMLLAMQSRVNHCQQYSVSC